MKYSIGVNICPSKTSGLCNQLYRILAIKNKKNFNAVMINFNEFLKN